MLERISSVSFDIMTVWLIITSDLTANLLVLLVLTSATALLVYRDIEFQAQDNVLTGTAIKDITFQAVQDVTVAAQGGNSGV